MHFSLLNTGKRNAPFLFTLLVLCCFVFCAFFPSADANNALAQKRRAKCGTPTDCVVIKADGAQLTVDGLNLDRDTPGAVLRRLPNWFGGQRPLTLVFNGRRLEKGLTLSRQGVEIGSPLSLTTVADAGEKYEL